jgi:hypothetical protein
MVHTFAFSVMVILVFVISISLTNALTTSTSNFRALRMSSSSSGEAAAAAAASIPAASASASASASDPAPIIPKTSFETAYGRSVKGKSWFKAKAVGVGSCAGQDNLPNSAFESLVDTNDAWIGKRTGIRNRHVIAKGSSMRDISIISAKAALADSGIDPKDIDLVLVATSSPDDLFGDAGSIAAAIGASNAAAFDLTAACSGFLFGVVTASQFIQTGTYKKVLVIGGDALTRFLDWKDRGTCILFGDGAGAIIMESCETEQESGILGFALHSDGQGYCNLNLPWVPNFAELPNDEKTVIDQVCC